MPAARIQPQGRARIDKKLGIRFLVNPAFGTTDQVGGLRLTSSFNTPTKGAAPQGVTRAYPNGADYYDTAGALRATTAYSVLVYADIASISQWAGLFAMTADTGTGSGFNVVQIQGTGPEIRVLENNNNYYSSSGGVAAKLFGVGPVACVIVWDGNRATLWASGQKLHDQTGVTVPPGYSAGTGRIKIMSSRDVAGVTGKMYVTAYAPNVAWSDAKAAELSRNPWAIYESQPAMLSAASVAPAADPERTGNLSATFGAATTSGAGAASVAGSLAKTLGGLSVSSAGTLAAAGALSKPLAGMTVAATGTAAVAGRNATLSTGLAGVTGSSAGAVVVAGNLAATMGGASLSSAGTAANAGRNAALAATLSGMTANAAAGATVAGTMAKPLGGLSSTAAGAVGVAGAASVAVGGLSITTAAGGAATATLSRSLGGMTATGAGAVAIQAQAGATMGGMSLAAAAASQNGAAFAGVLGGMSAAAAGGIAVRGAASVTFGSIQPGIISVARLDASLGGVGLAGAGRVYYFTRAPERTLRVLAQQRIVRLTAQNRKTSGRI